MLTFSSSKGKKFKKSSETGLRSSSNLYTVQVIVDWAQASLFVCLKRSSDKQIPLSGSPPLWGHPVPGDFSVPALTFILYKLNFELLSFFHTFPRDRHESKANSDARKHLQWLLLKHIWHIVALLQFIWSWFWLIVSMVRLTFCVWMRNKEVHLP